MDIKSFIIALFGLILSFLSVYHICWTRNLFLKQMLYAKQLEGFSEVLYALTVFYKDTMFFIFPYSSYLKDINRTKLREKTKETHDNFVMKHLKLSIYLPLDLNKKLDDYTEVYNAISSPLKHAKLYDASMVYSNDPARLISNIYEEAFDLAYTYLGTEYLSKEMLKMVKRRNYRIKRLFQR